MIPDEQHRLRVLFVAWIAYVAVEETRRETATFRNLEIIEELEEVDEGDGTSDRERSQAVSTMSVFDRQRWSGWINLGLAVVAIGGIIIGAATVSEGSDQILGRYDIEDTVFGATIITAVLSVEDLFLTVRPIRKGVPEIGIGRQPRVLGHRQARHRRPRRRQHRDRFQRPALAPPCAAWPDLALGVLLFPPGRSSAGTASYCSRSTSRTGSSASASTAAPPSRTDQGRASTAWREHELIG